MVGRSIRAAAPEIHDGRDPMRRSTYQIAASEDMVELANPYHEHRAFYIQGHRAFELVLVSCRYTQNLIQ